jgi:peptidoglycan/LPS O-acetylase OafA/YrhL
MKIKFHSFDALRFISFLIVFFSHLSYKYFSDNIFILFQGRGNIGVYFFFVLSGFLITYILLTEKKETNSIKLKNFMLRRVLRIWPLFYVMILFAVITSIIISYLNLASAHVGYSPNWLASCLFLENYQVIYHNQYANRAPLSVMWSLCVEEHFYIIWGLTLFFCKRNQVPKFIISFIFISLTTKYFFVLNDLKQLEILTNLDFFMYGAIPAYLIVFYKEQTEKFIQNTLVWHKISILFLALIIVLFSGHVDLGEFYFLENSIYGIIFGMVLFVFLPQEENRFRISDKNILSRLGTYTYGLYLIHIIVIILFEKIFIKYNIKFENHFTLYVCLSLTLTIIASYLSYYIIEKPFLKLKNKF